MERLPVCYYSFLWFQHAVFPVMAVLQEKPQEIQLEKVHMGMVIPVTIDMHIQNALPAEHRSMTVSVKNADTRTLIRDG